MSDEKIIYKDKNGKPFRVGDIFYYTEMPYSNYANGLYKVIEGISSVCLVTAFNGEYITIEEDDNPSGFEFHDRSHPTDRGICMDSEIVEIGGNLLDWINSNRPLSIKGEVDDDEKIFKAGRDVLRVQGYDGNWNYEPYMHGMYNGMELMLSLIEKRRPVFRVAPKKWVKESKFKEFLRKIFKRPKYKKILDRPTKDR